MKVIDFSDALRHLKLGGKVKRLGWHGRVMWIEMQRPDAGSANTLPYLFINIPRGDVVDRVPWVASHSDLLGVDWVHVEPRED